MLSSPEPTVETHPAQKRHMRPNAAAKFVNKYGKNWDRNLSDIAIEMTCIRWGGRWESNSTGKECGLGLEYHYHQLYRLLWPEEFWDECDEKIINQLIKGGVQGLVGYASAGKTHAMTAFALCLYFSFPTGTTIVMSTTTIPDLENRIWGQTMNLYNRAKARYPDLPGHCIASKHCIVTEQDEVEGQDFRNGLKGRACKVGEKWVGLGPYVGIHGDRVVILADEAQLMPPGYFEVVGNLASNKWWLLAASGNPNDPTTSFGRVCEPKIGWDLLEQGDGDQVWESKTGQVLRLDGLFAPNLRPGAGNEPCKNKISHRYINYIRDTYGEGSFQWNMWVRAKFILQILEKRLFIRKFAEQHRAFDDPMFGEEPLTHLFAIDAAYGAIGGDRCVGGHFRFGKCTDGKIRLALKSGPLLIPVKAGGDVLPENQIVFWVREYCERNDIPASHVGLDSTGRGSLVSSFAKVWSPDIIAIEFGGKPSERPDPQNPRRLAKEGYFNFASEMAFALRSCIEADQFRGLTLDICMEAEMRAWYNAGKSQFQQIEPKEETRDRIKRSPDLLDMAICGLELARRLGFVLGEKERSQGTGIPKWLLDLNAKQAAIKIKHELVYR